MILLLPSLCTNNPQKVKAPGKKKLKMQPSLSSKIPKQKAADEWQHVPKEVRDQRRDAVGKEEDLSVSPWRFGMNQKGFVLSFTSEKPLQEK